MTAERHPLRISPEVGEWLIWGTVTEGLGWPIIGDGAAFVLTNAVVAGVLAAVVVWQLAHRERVKRPRIVARDGCGLWPGIGRWEVRHG